MLDNPISWSRKCVLALTASMVMTVGACITISAPVTQTSDQARLLDEFSQLYAGDALFSKDNVGTILHVEFSDREVLISPTELNSGFKIDRSVNPEIASGYYLSGQEGSEGFAALIFTLDHSKNCLPPELVAATLPGIVTQVVPPSLIPPDTVTYWYRSDDLRNLYAIITTKNRCVYGGQIGRGTPHWAHDRRHDGPSDSSPDTW